MNPRGVTGRARRAAEAMMLDLCEIQRISGTSQNPDGSVTPTYTTAYSGKCKIQRLRGAFAQNPVAGEHLWTLVPTEIHVPVVGTNGVQVDDKVTITASVDPNNVGRVYRVKSSDRKTFQSAIRLQVEEVTG